MITIHFEDGRDLGVLIRELQDLAGPGRKVATGRGGVTVDEELAYAWLSSRRPEPEPADPAPDDPGLLRETTEPDDQDAPDVKPEPDDTEPDDEDAPADTEPDAPAKASEPEPAPAAPTATATKATTVPASKRRRQARTASREGATSGQ